MYASKATVTRLPIYLRYLRDKLDAGETYVSSTTIADDLQRNSVQVRKDLALVSRVSGKPKIGFEIVALIDSIERFLGCNNAFDAVLVGVGGLGSTLLGYEGFRNYGLNLVAAFDNRAAVIGKTFGKVTVQPIGQIAETVRRQSVKIGIITVPKQAAQAVADELVGSGIRAIWNFAPTHLLLPDTVAVRHEDLAASLAVLSRKLLDVLKRTE